MSDSTQGGNDRSVYVIAGVAALGGLSFGFNTGVISGALLSIRRQFELSSMSQGWVVSAVLLGCIFGAALGGKLADRFGRKNLILACAGVFFVGSFATAAAHSIEALIWGRVVIGVAIGAASFAVPLYISEISPPRVRGALVSLNQLMLSSGIVLSYLVDDLFTGFENGWRYMFLMGIGPALLLGVGMLFLPETPRFLMGRGRESAAREVMERLQGTSDVEDDLAAIRKSAANKSAGGWSALAQPWLRPALLIGVGIMFVQQATGINTVVYYGPTIFQMAGFDSDVAAISATLGVGVANVLFTLVAIRLVDRWGRKPLLSMSLVGIVASLVVLGSAFYLQDTLGPALRWVAVGSVLVYRASFALSLGPVAWLLISEIYPLEVRGLAMSLATLSNWVFNFFIALTFLSIIELLGEPATFWLYAVVGVCGWFFCRYWVPETKGASLEVIEANLKSGRRPRDLGQALLVNGALPG
jgi:SP family galactose:H+ symporter-like MFS transporter